jgi:hypothetical protein
MATGKAQGVLEDLFINSARRVAPFLLRSVLSTSVEASGCDWDTWEEAGDIRRNRGLCDEVLATGLED